MDHDGLHLCARGANALTAVVGRKQGGFSQRNADILHAAWLAVLLTGIIAALSARLLARVVVRPLRELRDSVAMLPGHPGDVPLQAHGEVSEVEALCVALRDTLSRLSSSLAQSERFARDAAHELRTPLTAILGELELIAERTSESEREDIMRVHTIAQRQSSWSSACSCSRNRTWPRWSSASTCSMSWRRQSKRSALPAIAWP
ncbi:MAG TPA: histidine kinase dimerization/phospho-acceptor domain-containing protein [Polyangiales bacterium]|nr:histidine kinase dimerization/phospho-acceptor domain-containing protein [Polyangiales bacterium]